jgi:hypothetical protein
LSLGDEMPTLNWLAILVAAMLRMAVGTAWYSPLLFVKPWQALSGVTPDSMKAGMGRAIFVDAVMSLLMAFVFYYVLHTAPEIDVVRGVLLGVFIWIGFVLATSLPLWGYENRPLKLIAINAGHNLVALVLMGALLGAWH